MGLYQDGKLVIKYPIATSKFGLGDKVGSYKTPLGRFEVARKIGAGKPLGAVFKYRVWTGEILKPDSPGRDPIVSRILWLNGLEEQNKNAFKRFIYIHGTAAEREVGRKTSYGCVRMKSKDIIDLFSVVGWGAYVDIVERPLWPGIETPIIEKLEVAVPSVSSGELDLFPNPLDKEVLFDEFDFVLADPNADFVGEEFEEAYFEIEPAPLDPE